jgi:hypothetical protein
MAVQFAEAVTSSSEWARIAVVANVDVTYTTDIALSTLKHTYTFSSNASGLLIRAVSSASAVDYDPRFVTEMLAADAAEPEATFNNVVDMLGWLNRE